MSRQVEYGKQCRIESLGRNRYIKTTGLDIVTQADELLLFPLNARGARTDSCRIVVPMTAAPEIADALITAATPTLHDQLGFWPQPSQRRALLGILAAYDDDESPDYDDRLEAAMALARRAVGDLLESE